jgi:hypothetical protein
VNPITVTGMTLDSTPYTALVNVTRTGSDTTNPTGSITFPTSGATFTTTDSAAQLSGTYGDNVAVSSVAVTCTESTPSTPTVSLVNGLWQTAAFTYAVGSNHCSVVITDSSSNTTTLSLLVTLTAVSNAAPTISIAVPNGSGSSTTSTAAQTVSGTASDDATLPAGAVTWTSTGCGSGTATGTTAWSLSLTLAASCTVTVTVTDAGGLTATAQHVFTYNQPLSIATPPNQTTVEGANFSYCFQITGGTAPYTVTKLTGTYPTGFALTGSSPTFCIGDSSVNTGTAGTYAGHSYRVTDNAAATADTGTFSIVIGTGSLGGQNNSYFDSLCARADLMPGRCYSMRDNTQLYQFANKVNVTALSNTVCPNNGNRQWWYDPVNDTDPERQDAAKFRICTWVDTGGTLAAAMSGAATAGTVETITVTNTDHSNPGRAYLIGSEMVVCVPLVSGGACKVDATHMTVMRGMHGTSVAAHAIGDPTWPSTSIISTQLLLPFSSAGTVTESFFVVWDLYPTANWAARPAIATISRQPGRRIRARSSAPRQPSASKRFSIERLAAQARFRSRTSLW